MTTIVLVFGIVFVFFIGLISPKHAEKIQRETNKKAKKLKKYGGWFWDPITWWVNTSIETSRKIITVTTEWGKKSRRKLKELKK